MNNILVKNKILNITANTEMPFNDVGNVSLKSNQIIYSSVNNIFQRMVVNDLYIEKKLLNGYNYTEGPKKFSDEKLSSSSDGYKFWLQGNSDQNLSLLFKQSVPLSDTFYSKIPYNGNFMTLDGKYTLGTDDKVYIGDTTDSINETLNFGGKCYYRNTTTDEMFIGGKDGLYEKKINKTQTTYNEIIPQPIDAIYKNKDIIYYGNETGLSSCYFDDDNVQHITYMQLSKPISSIFTMNDILYVGTNDGLYKQDKRNKFINFKSYDIHSNVVYDGFVGSERGIYKNKQNDIEKINILKTDSSSSEINNKNITAIFRNGNIIYVGTSENNVYEIQITNDSYSEIKKTSIGYTINDIYVYNQTVMVATNNGVYYYQPYDAELKSVTTVKNCKSFLYQHKIYLIATSTENNKEGIFEIVVSTRTISIREFIKSSDYGTRTIVSYKPQYDIVILSKGIDVSGKQILSNEEINDATICTVNGESYVFALCDDKIIKYNLKTGATDNWFETEYSQFKKIEIIQNELIILVSNDNKLKYSFKGLDQQIFLSDYVEYTSDNFSDIKSIISKNNGMIIHDETSLKSVYIGNGVKSELSLEENINVEYNAYNVTKINSAAVSSDVIMYLSDKSIISSNLGTTNDQKYVTSTNKINGFFKTDLFQIDIYSGTSDDFVTLLDETSTTEFTGEGVVYADTKGINCYAKKPSAAKESTYGILTANDITEIVLYNDLSTGYEKSALKQIVDNEPSYAKQAKQLADNLLNQYYIFIQNGKLKVIKRCEESGNFNTSTSKVTLTPSKIVHDINNGFDIIYHIAYGSYMIGSLEEPTYINYMLLDTDEGVFVFREKEPTKTFIEQLNDIKNYVKLDNIENGNNLFNIFGNLFVYTYKQSENRIISYLFNPITNQVEKDIEAIINDTSKTITSLYKLESAKDVVFCELSKNKGRVYSLIGSEYKSLRKGGQLNNVNEIQYSGSNIVGISDNGYKINTYVFSNGSISIEEKLLESSSEIYNNLNVDRTRYIYFYQNNKLFNLKIGESYTNLLYESFRDIKGVQSNLFLMSDGKYQLLNTQYNYTILTAESKCITTGDRLKYIFGKIFVERKDEKKIKVFDTINNQIDDFDELGGLTVNNLFYDEQYFIVNDDGIFNSTIFNEGYKLINDFEYENVHEIKNRVIIANNNGQTNNTHSYSSVDVNALVFDKIYDIIVKCFYKYSENIVLLGTYDDQSKGLYKFDSRNITKYNVNNRINSIFFNNTETDVYGNIINKIIFCSDKKVYQGIITTDNNIFKIKISELFSTIKIKALKHVSKINNIFLNIPSEIVLLTDKGVYQTKYTYVVDEIYHDIMDFSTKEMIENEVSSQLEKHKRDYHNSESLITKINEKVLDVDLNEISIHTLLKNYEYGDGNGNIEIDYVSVNDCDLSNFSNSPFKKISDFSYIIKEYSNDLKEIFINLPTTSTNYVPHNVNQPNCQYFDTSLLNESKIIRLRFNRRAFTMNRIIDIQIKGTSLPLKIYKDNTHICNGNEKTLHSFIKPSIQLMDSQTGDDEYYDFYFQNFGTDEQNIRIAYA